MATISLRELEEQLTASAEAGLRKALIPAMRAATKDVEEAARANIRRQFTMRSRSFINSVRSEVLETQEGTEGVISAGGQSRGVDFKGARLHEYGGTILPVKGKYLTIPVDAGLTGPGIPRYQSVRHMPFALWLPIRGGGKLKFIVVDKRNDELFYLVVTSSTVPARPYLRPALNQVLATLPDRLAASAAAALVA